MKEETKPTDAELIEEAILKIFSEHTEPACGKHSCSECTTEWFIPKQPYYYRGDVEEVLEELVKKVRST